MIYKGPHDINEIKRFIIEVYQKINSKQKFSSAEPQKKIPAHKSTPFSEGIPLWGDNDDISYLHFDEVNGYHIPNNLSGTHTNFNEGKGYFK